MNLTAYLNRIQYGGTPRPDLATLTALHRQHQLTVPFENLDVQLGRSLDTTTEAAYAKIVERRRGGWCYEMNGLFSWALREIGFDVTRLSAGVMRERVGDFQLGNHLCLHVALDEPYLADVGFGGSLFEPLPLRAIERTDTPYRLQLTQVEDGYWRFIERTHGDPFSFDFRTVPADETLLTQKCDYQRADPASPFVQNVVVQRRTHDTHLSLRGRVLSITTAAGIDKTMLNSAAEFITTLAGRFDLVMPDAATLWTRIVARHSQLFEKH
jgi:N-hydroxyarylamine O-acetyltransferase